MNIAMDDYHKYYGYDINWPFNANGFDYYVNVLNRKDELAEEEKDEILTISVKKFRKIKKNKYF
ncbi:hypothetical protein SCORR_v1c05940 [Spiroplasma corruscae]|uniref:Uncharacterized protein n=1 Tax=Spiroplasma corruscae TaxID=216934 RepID=A0A222EPK0_9MOLU|nr:hypothetical protein [Spiroplasma corruscae]ASP28366.1 hypothetical protein SCORR_v1c05940 [Spiroplasma corruscae]